MTAGGDRPLEGAGSDAAVAELESRMAALRVRARVGLLDRVTALEGGIAALGTQDPPAEAWTEAAQHAHRIAGNAGTFDFPRGSDIAREIEDLLATADLGTTGRHERLRTLVRELRAELEQP